MATPAPPSLEQLLEDLDTAEPTEADVRNAERLLNLSAYTTTAIVALITALNNREANEEAEVLTRLLDPIELAEARRILREW